jgi:hypothetical protein
LRPRRYELDVELNLLRPRMRARVRIDLDAFADPARRFELYHELTHLWNVRCTDPAPSRWEEGLAVWLQDRMADRLDGTDREATADERNLAAVRRLLARFSDGLRVPGSGGTASTT